jgi:hypothetical protein
MKRSLETSSIDMFKMHVSVVDAHSELKDDDVEEEKIKLYPVMDGVYIVSEKQKPLLMMLDRVFSSLAKTVTDVDKIYHTFVIRATIAYGPVIHGEDVPDVAANSFDDYSEYKKSLLLGIPMIQSFRAERNEKVPPFGIYIHESARSFSPKKSSEDVDEDSSETPFNVIWWKWFESEYKDYDHICLAYKLRQQLNQYYSWCIENNHELKYYKKEKMREHQEMVAQYFPADIN